jgi:Domain of Unknown Function (DUF1206)
MRNAQADARTSLTDRRKSCRFDVTAIFPNGFAFLIYLGLALTAGALALGWNAHVSADRNAESRHLSARILTVPFGRPLLFAVAVGVLVAAVVQVRWAFGPNHIRERLRVDEMTERQCKVVMGVGRIAFGTRAAVLATCGYFAARGAWQSSFSSSALRSIGLSCRHVVYCEPPSKTRSLLGPLVQWSYLTDPSGWCVYTRSHSSAAQSDALAVPQRQPRVHTSTPGMLGMISSHAPRISRDATQQQRTTVRIESSSGAETVKSHGPARVGASPTQTSRIRRMITTISTVPPPI